MKIYVASSWRNESQPHVVLSLRDAGHQVYDFKDEEGFHWSEVDPKYSEAAQRLAISPGEIVNEFARYRTGLEHPRAVEGFNRDFAAMEWADAFVLVMPSGRSAHLEAGWAIGKGKPTCIFFAEFDGTWDLMYSMADFITDRYAELWRWVRDTHNAVHGRES